MISYLLLVREEMVAPEGWWGRRQTPAVKIYRSCCVRASTGEALKVAVGRFEVPRNPKGWQAVKLSLL